MCQSFLDKIIPRSICGSLMLHPKHKQNIFECALEKWQGSTFYVKGNKPKSVKLFMNVCINSVYVTPKHHKLQNPSKCFLTTCYWIQIPPCHHKVPKSPNPFCENEIIAFDEWYYENHQLDSLHLSHLTCGACPKLDCFDTFF